MKFLTSEALENGGTMILAECPDGSIFVDVTWHNFSCGPEGTREWWTTDEAHLEAPQGWDIARLVEAARQMMAPRFDEWQEFGANGMWPCKYVPSEEERRYESLAFYDALAGGCSGYTLETVPLEPKCMAYATEAEAEAFVSWEQSVKACGVDVDEAMVEEWLKSFRAKERSLDGLETVEAMSWDAAARQGVIDGDGIYTAKAFAIIDGVR